MRQKVGFFTGFLLALLVWTLPSGALTPQAHRLAAITTLVVIYWITEPIPIPVAGLLGVTLAILLGVAPADQVLAAFGDPIVFLFIGSFMLAKAMQVHGVDRRIAYALLAHPWVGGSTYRTLWAMGLVAWLLAMWTSITACAAMLFPVALAVGKATGEALASSGKGAGQEVARRYTTSLLLMLTYAASAGALATPVGTPPNLIGIGFIRDQLGISIGFLQWMIFGLPLAVLMLVTRYALVLLLFPPSIREVPGQLESMRALQKGLGPWTAGQSNSLLAFGTAIVLWITPGLVSLVSGPTDPVVKILNDRFVPGVVALLAAALLFLLPIDWKRRNFTLEWEEAAQIDWGTVLLFGSGIALGRMMLDTGLAAVVGRGLLGITGTSHSAAMIGVAIVVALIVSELASNTAATMVIPVMLSLVSGNQTLGLSIALGTTFGVSLGFMLPVSTPANAIVYGSGAIRMWDMVKAGAVVDLVGVLLIWAFSFWVVPLLAGRF